MAWARVQSVGTPFAVPNGITTESVTLGSAPTTGNVLVAVVSIDSGSSVPTLTNVKDGNGVSFTLVKNIAYTANSTDGNMAVYVLVVPATPSTTVTANFASTALGAGAAIFCAEFSGISTVIDGTAAGNNQATGTVTQPGYTSTAVNELLISCYGDDGDPTVAAGSWTADTNNVKTSTHASAGIQYKNSTNGAEAGGGWSSASGGDAGIVVFALKLPGGGTNHNQTVTASPISTSVVQRQIGRPIKAVSTSTGAMTAMKVKLLTALASVTSHADLNMIITMHMTGASVSSAATVTAMKVKILNALASVTSTSKVGRSIGKIIGGAATTTSALSRQIGRKTTATGTSTSALTRSIGWITSASVTSTGATLVTKVKILIATASATSAGSLVRQVTKTIQGSGVSTSRITRLISPARYLASVTSTASRTVGIGKTFLASATSTGAASVTKVKIVIATASANSSAFLARQIGRVVPASVTSNSTLIRQLGKKAQASVTSNSGIIRQVGKTIVAGAVSVGNAVATKIGGGGTQHNQTVTAAVTSGVSLVRQVGKVAQGGVTTSLAMIRGLGKIVQSNPTSTGNVTKGITHTVAASSTSTGSTFKQVGRTFLAGATSTCIAIVSRAHLITLTAISTTTSLLKRNIGKLAAASPIASIGMVRGISKFVRAAPSTVAHLITSGGNTGIPTVLVYARSRVFTATARIRSFIVEARSK